VSNSRDEITITLRMSNKNSWMQGHVTLGNGIAKTLPT